MATRFGSANETPKGSRRWHARYWVGKGHDWTDADGNLRRTAKGKQYRLGVFDTLKEANGALNEIHQQIRDGKWVPPGEARREPKPPPTFKDWAEDVMKRKRPKSGTDPMESQRKGRVKPRTWNEYRRILDVRLLPEFGDARLDQVTPERVYRWYSEFEAEPGSRRGGDVARARSYALLKVIFNEAITLEKIDRSPCRVKDGAQVDPPERPELPSEADLFVLIDAMPAHLKLALQLGARTGMRVGEVLGLQRGDFALERGAEAVKVSRQADGAGRLVSLKTKRSGRSIPIGPRLAGIVRAHLDDHCGPEPGALLFPAKDGTRAIPRSSFTYHWDKARAAAGWKPGDGRDLCFVQRHYGLSRIAEVGGLSDLQAMKIGGHVTISAHARYREPDAEAQREAMRRVEGAEAER